MSDLEAQITDFVQSQSEEEAKTLLEEINKPKDNIETDLIDLQLSKKDVTTSILSPLEFVLEPEIMAFVQEGLRNLTCDQIQNAEKIAKEQKEKEKQEKIEKLISIEMEKQNSISDIIIPFQDVLPPDMLKIVNESLKDVAIQESEKEVFNNEDLQK